VIVPSHVADDHMSAAPARKPARSPPQPHSPALPAEEVPPPPAFPLSDDASYITGARRIVTAASSPEHAHQARLGHS